MDARTETTSDNPRDPIDYWRKHLRWPQTYFESEDNMAHLLVQNNKPPPPLRRKESTSSFTSGNTAPSQPDHKSRDGKSAKYRDKRYETLLEAHNSFLCEDNIGVNKEVRDLCVRLLQADQSIPQNSLFDDHIFRKTCDYIRNSNESRLIRDIALLIVPSAATLELHGLLSSEISENLVEAVNQGWDGALPITSPRPQPDYSVGFNHKAFEKGELEVLEPFIGTAWDRSYFKGTYFMYFPFLTCEVKCGAEALSIADRQNANSMTLAVRGVTELFRLVKREKEVDRKILAFSVSHDDSIVRIYGHYPVIKGKETEYYRHEVDKFDFTSRYGQDRWTAYKFTKNVYEMWAPAHLKQIRSAIREIKDHFVPPREPGPQSSNQTPASHDSVLSIAHAEDVTPETPVSLSAKKPKTSATSSAQRRKKQKTSATRSATKQKK